MSDNLRRYRAIRDALTRVSWQAHRHGCQALDHAGSAHQRDRGQEHPTAQRRHQNPRWYKPEPGQTLDPLARQRAHLGGAVLLPYAEILLAHLACATLVLVMDGSVVGRGCVALMIHVIYKGRALPLAWRVRQGPKGRPRSYTSRWSN